MASVEERRLTLWQGKVETSVEISGSGPPLVYLHGPWGLRCDREFVARLAAGSTVYAPKHPGTTPGDSEAAHQIDNFWDLIVYYGELFDRLSLDAPAVVGHSFGGMVAAEIAAMVPSRVRKLVLIDPVGLWRDDLPVRNWMIMPEDERARALFADPAGDAAKRFFGLPDDPKARIQAQVDFIWAQACTGKYVWPVPDKGLKKHIHRIACAKPHRLGQGGRHRRAGLCPGIRGASRQRAGRARGARRPSAASRAGGNGGAAGARLSRGLSDSASQDRDHNRKEWRTDKETTQNSAREARPWQSRHRRPQSDLSRLRTDGPSTAPLCCSSVFLRGRSTSTSRR